MKLLANGAVGQRHDFRPELLEACIQAIPARTGYPVCQLLVRKLVCRVDESWGGGRQKRGAMLPWNSNPLDPPTR